MKVGNVTKYVGVKTTLPVDEKDLAQRLAEENADGLQLSQAEWQDILEMTAAAKIDEDDNRSVNRELKRPEWQGAKIRAVVRAEQELQKEAEKNTLITWRDGTAIKVHGEEVRAFRATALQYQDSTLFGAPIPSIPIENNREDFALYKKRPYGGVYGDKEAEHQREIINFMLGGSSNLIEIRRRNSDYRRIWTPMCGLR